MGAKNVQRKTNILSVRVSDHEMEYVREIMERTSRSASEVLRDAFRSLCEHGDQTLAASRPCERRH
ncbi:hypothetical protein [Geoalkalibacter halelectricus]|uniref:hypothetical protein n=1 Tax=Geoalkalibacter halelectricus TaxID=2847045 RepID=UPI003D1EB25E